MRERYYRRDGTPYKGKYDFLEWAKDFSRPEIKWVALTRLPSGIDVSTVWLGLDHSFGNGPPMIFETMVFNGTDDMDMMRYSTEEEAIKGHAKMVAKQKKKLKLK